MNIHLYHPWNDAEVEYTERLYEQSCAYCAWNCAIDAANTAEYAAKLWAAAKGASDFRAAVNKARLFTAGAKYAMKKAHEYGGFKPLKNYNPSTVYTEAMKHQHL